MGSIGIGCPRIVGSSGRLPGFGSQRHSSGPGRCTKIRLALQDEEYWEFFRTYTQGLIAMAVSLTTIIGGLGYVVYARLGYQQSSVDYTVKQAASKLAMSQFTFEEPPKYIHRNQVVSELREVVRRSHTIRYAVLVTGPRGSGKTTLLREIVHGETGVGLPLSEATWDYFASTVLSLLMPARERGTSTQAWHLAAHSRV